MTATSVNKKRKLTAKEKAEVAVFKKAYWYITHDWSNRPCPNFYMNCPTCQHYLLVGMLEDHIATLEY